MNYAIRNNIEWIMLEETDNLQNIPFFWGDEGRKISPGHVFEKIGSKDRTSFQLDVPITYKGRIDEMLFFDVNGSSSENWYASLMYVNDCVLLARTSENGFYDIKY